jgi:hypothetical protein
MTGEVYNHFLGREIQQEALDWLNNTDDHPWSFIWICRELDLNHEYILVGTKAIDFKEKMGGFYKANRKYKTNRKKRSKVRLPHNRKVV